jgi:hypothetical protein
VELMDSQVNNLRRRSNIFQLENNTISAMHIVERCKVDFYQKKKTTKI